MSVPMLMNVLDSPSPTVPLIDEHTENCNATANNVIQLSPEPIPEKICFQSQRQFSVQLKGPLEANEHMGLTGDTFELGSWDPLRSVQLTAISPNIWGSMVSLCVPGMVQYRYFVYTLDSVGRIQIKRWESYVEPRKLRTCYHGCMRIDEFGLIDGHKQITRGWLTNEAIIQFKFFNDVFTFEDAAVPERLYLKLVPLANDTELPNYNENLDKAEVVKMKYRNSILEHQPDIGVLYESGDIVVFQLPVPLGLDDGSYALVIHSADSQPLGHAVISPSSITENDGKLELNITTPDGARAIASAKVSYVIIKPLSSGARLNFRTSYAYTWKSNWNKLLVGHRGNGISFKPNGALVIENTIASYKKAFEAKADMIELDVHITHDLVPVIYHDYKIFTAPAGTHPQTKDDLIQVYIKDIRYSQLQDMPIYRIIGDEIKEFPSHNAETRPDHRIFPTLEDVFQGLPLGLGINIEIKWPQPLADGSLEAPQILDKNLFVDLILMTTLRDGCGRMLLFSSFDADICTMVRVKQNMLPVMFLTQGVTSKWRSYEDPRCNSVEEAINNAQAFDLIGVAPHAEEILNEPRLARLATDIGQKVFLWGDDINSLERVKFFERAGVTANIFDRVDLIIPSDKPSGVFDNRKSMEYFKGQCAV